MATTLVGVQTSSDCIERDWCKAHDEPDTEEQGKTGLARYFHQGSQWLYNQSIKAFDKIPDTSNYTRKHATISRWVREAAEVEAKEIAETKGKEEMAKIADETLTSISETAPVLEDTITDPQFDSGWIDQSLQGRSSIVGI